MESLRRTDPGDAASLSMENELLRYEIRHLRARLASKSNELQLLVTRVERSEARVDLVWLLSRLEGSPAAPLLRRRPRYRELVATYLTEPTK